MEGQLTKYPFIYPRIFCQCKFLLELPLSLAVCAASVHSMPCIGIAQNEKPE